MVMEYAVVYNYNVHCLVDNGPLGVCVKFHIHTYKCLRYLEKFHKYLLALFCYVQKYVSSHCNVL